MPTPTVSDRHVSRPLTNISIAFTQETDKFVADKVFPLVPSPKQGDLYTSYDKADWFRIQAQERAPGTESAGGDYGLSREPFFCRRYSLHDDVDDPSVANSDEELDPYEDSTLFITENMWMKREFEWAAAHFQSGSWTNQSQGVAAAPAGGQFLQWDQAGSTPVDDVLSRQAAIAALTGRKPNVGVITLPTFNALKNNADVRDRFKYTSGGSITREMIAGVLELDRLLVAEGVTNSANEGGAESTDFILGRNMLLAYANPRPTRKAPSAGYTFAWTGLTGAGRNGTRIKRFRVETHESDRIEIDATWDFKKVSDDLAHLLLDTVA